MNYAELKKIVSMRKAAKQASDADGKIRRCAEIMGKLAMNIQAKEASEPRPTTACQRAFRRHMMEVKKASDGLTPLERVKSLLDAKVASDPALRAMKIIGEARARKEAMEVRQQQARKVTLESPTSKPVFEKPLEGQEQKDEGRSVTFSDGRTVNFPAAHSTPVKSASDRVKEILAFKRAQEAAAQPPVEPVQQTPVLPTPAPATAPVPAPAPAPAPAKPKVSMWQRIGQGAEMINTARQTARDINGKLTPEQKRRIAEGIGGVLNKGQQVIQNRQVPEADQQGKQAVLNGIDAVRGKVNQWGGINAPAGK